MLSKINVDKLRIYTNEIISSKILEELSTKEKILQRFEAQVNNVNKKAFATFPSDKRHIVEVNEGDYVVIRAIKDNNVYEFISQIRKWGKFHIPVKVIRELYLKNHEKIDFVIVKPIELPQLKMMGKEYIDLSQIEENIDIIYRENNFITLIQGGKVPITLPRYIKVNADLIELFYLIHGDGHYQNKLYFVNKDPGLHRFVISKFEEIFKVPKSLWRARLLINNDSDFIVAKEHWKNKLNLEELQFYPTISKSLLKTSEFGNLRIVIDKTIVSVVFRFIFDRLQILDKKNSLYALNGLLCAEGSPEKSKRGLHRITISFSQKEKNMFQEILNKAEIGSSTINLMDRFVIENWNSLYQFFKIFFSNNIIPFSLHHQRCKNALGGFLDHSFTRTIYKYLTILKNKNSFTIKELINITNHNPESMLNTLRKPQYSRFIKIEGKGINRNPLLISITREGEEFLTLIERIREVYDERCKSEQNKERKKYK